LTTINRATALALALAASLAAQSARPRAAAIQLTAEPAKVRPFENAVIRATATGVLTGTDAEGKETKKEGRVELPAWEPRVATANGGWLSKPFKYQGRDNTPMLGQESGLLGGLLNRAMTDFTIKDSVLYLYRPRRARQIHRRSQSRLPHSHPRNRGLLRCARPG